MSGCLKCSLIIDVFGQSGFSIVVTLENNMMLPLES